MGSDLHLFPSREAQAQAFHDQPAPEIRVITARLEKKRLKSETLPYDPDHVRTSVIDRLTQFSFLNDPPTVTVSTDYSSPCSV